MTTAGRLTWNGRASSVTANANMDKSWSATASACVVDGSLRIGVDTRRNTCDSAGMDPLEFGTLADIIARIERASPDGIALGAQLVYRLNALSDDMVAEDGLMRAARMIRKDLRLTKDGMK